MQRNSWAFFCHAPATVERFSNSTARCSNAARFDEDDSAAGVAALLSALLLLVVGSVLTLLSVALVGESLTLGIGALSVIDCAKQRETQQKKQKKT